MLPVNDLTLIESIKNGDTRVFELLVKKYQKPLFIMASNFIADYGRVEDLVQETFMAAYLGLHKYEPDKGMFSTWIFTIARNKCLNELKKKRELLPGRLPDRIAKEDPAKTFAEGEMMEKLNRALNTLPFSDRSIFILAEFNGLSYREIAEIESMNIGTVKSRLSRTKKKLRSILNPESQDRTAHEWK